MRGKLTVSVLLAGTAMTAPLDAVAQDAEIGNTEIVVTAQKREENAQDVPITISALSGEQTENAGISTVDGLVSRVPGLNSRSDGPTQTVFAVRGIGTNAFGVGVDASVGVFVDDVYIGHPVLANASFFDVDRIEVVKGPQGTLFGRNTSAGAVSVISKKPEAGETYFEGKFGYGSDGQKLVRGIVNLSGTDSAGIRLGAQYEERDGTFVNRTDDTELNNKKALIFRLNAFGEINDNFRADFLLEHSKEDGRYGVVEVNPANRKASAKVREVWQGVREDVDVDATRAVLKLAYELNPDITLTSITSYLDINSNTTPTDFDIAAVTAASDFVDVTFSAGPDDFQLDLLPFREPGEFKFFSTELRLNGTSDSVDWFVGASFRRDKLSNDTSLVGYNDFHLIPLFFEADCDVVAIDFGLPVSACNENAEEHSPARAIVKSWGVYGDVTWRATDRLSVTAGARYSKDKKRMRLTVTPSTGILGALDTAVVKPITGTGMASESWSEFTPRVSVKYDVTDNAMVYATYSKGYKSGGFNSSFDENGVILPVDPETNSAYEVGFKSDLMGNRLRLNGALFYSDYNDFQIEVQNGAAFTIRNVASAEIKGGEIEATLSATRDLRFQASYTYLDTEMGRGMINGIDITGNRLPFAPKHSVVVAADYSTYVDFGVVGLNATLAHTSMATLSPLGPAAPQLFSESNTNLDLRASVGADDGSWEFAVIGQNVLGDRYFTTVNDIIDQPIGIPNYRRSVRAEVSFRF